jgi:outer membrane protein, multidrug efflux system
MGRAAVILLASLLGACAQLAPPHVLPDLPTPEVYPPELAADATAAERAVEIGWREFFVDERLEALIATALERNRELSIAIWRIEQARGIHQIQDASRLPTVVAGASASTGRAGGQSFDRYSIGVGASAFELDFWGRVRNLSEAARSDYLATIEAQRAFRLLLIREVASVYLFSLEAAERIQIAEATVASREEGLEIARVRMDAGVTSALEFRQAESLLTQAQAELARLRLSKLRNDNALLVLVGVPFPDLCPGPLHSRSRSPRARSMKACRRSC